MLEAEKFPVLPDSSGISHYTNYHDCVLNGLVMKGGLQMIHARTPVLELDLIIFIIIYTLNYEISKCCIWSFSNTS